MVANPSSGRAAKNFLEIDAPATNQAMGQDIACEAQNGNKMITYCPCGHKIILCGYEYLSFCTIKCPGCKYLFVVNLSADQNTERNKFTGILTNFKPTLGDEHR